MMGIEYNTNAELLMGGSYCGNASWNKDSGSIDNCFKLYYVHGGNASVLDEDHTVDLHEGGLYFINGFKLTSQRCVKLFMVDWIHFLPKSLYFAHLLKQLPLVVELELEDFISFDGLFQKFDPFFENHLSEAEARCVLLEAQTLVSFTIAKLFRRLDADIAGGNEKLRRLLPAIEYIAENYRKVITLQELAEKCCLSPNYFHRLFSEEYQQSPLNYIRSLRLDEAIRQLVYTNQAVKTIAYNVGYDDEAYFSRVFSKKYGASPGSYKRQFKKKIP